MTESSNDRSVPGPWSARPPTESTGKGPAGTGPAGPGGSPEYQPQPGWAAWQGGSPAPTYGAAHSSGTQTVLAVISLVAMGLAASIPFDDTIWWVTMTAWAVFGVLACITLVLSAAGAFGRGRQWTISAVAAASVIATWVLIALPAVASNAGFAATISALAAFGSVALTPGRRI